MGGVTTMQMLAGRAIYVLQVAFWLTAVLGFLALVLTVSGLFSVLSYVVAQRSKEIGVRMALGARTPDIARLVVLQSARPVGVGLVVGGVLAGSLASALMATPAASRSGSVRSSTSSIRWRTRRACSASSRRVRWRHRFPRCARRASIRSRRPGRTDQRDAGPKDAPSAATTVGLAARVEPIMAVRAGMMLTSQRTATLPAGAAVRNLYTHFGWRSRNRRPKRILSQWLIWDFGSRCFDEVAAEIVPNTQPLPRERSKSLDHSELPVLFR
jgi:hypothetical protein